MAVKVIVRGCNRGIAMGIVESPFIRVTQNLNHINNDLWFKEFMTDLISML